MGVSRSCLLSTDAIRIPIYRNVSCVPKSRNTYTSSESHQPLHQMINTISIAECPRIIFCSLHLLATAVPKEYEVLETAIECISRRLSIGLSIRPQLAFHPFSNWLWQSATLCWTGLIESSILRLSQKQMAGRDF